VTSLPQPASRSPWSAARRAGRGAGAGAWVSRSASVWLWLLLLGAVCLAETVTHLGARNGFLESSRPLYASFGAGEHLPADGYVTWVGNVPVLQDAESFIKLAAFFAGRQGPQATGFLDRRAAYGYLASLVVPWMPWDGGAYAAFVALNLVFWWGAAGAMFWLVRRRSGDVALAAVASLLVATGNGMTFMVGLPQSYVPAYAAAVFLLALAEWLGVWRPPHRPGSWLLLGWGAGVAATIYVSHFAIVLFWWLYGLRRVPWPLLLLATALAAGIVALWEVAGQGLAGLAFRTDNSGLASEAVRRWTELPVSGWRAVVDFARRQNVISALWGAFPPPFWLLAALGLAVASREEREWSVAALLAGVLPALAIMPMFGLPRIAYFAYPGVYTLAAMGVLWLARRLARCSGEASLHPARARAARVATAAALLGLLVLAANADLLGDRGLNAAFHYGVGIQW
jgi:hypothetical protein